MKIVIVNRVWWRFWRRPFWGWNPWAWYTIDELPTYRLLTHWVDGYAYPGDGGEGEFQWRSGESSPEAYDLPCGNFVIDGEEGGVAIPPNPSEDEEWIRVTIPESEYWTRKA